MLLPWSWGSAWLHFKPQALDGPRQMSKFLEVSTTKGWIWWMGFFVCFANCFWSGQQNWYVGSSRNSRTDFLFLKKHFVFLLSTHANCHNRERQLPVYFNAAWNWNRLSGGESKQICSSHLNDSWAQSWAIVIRCVSKTIMRVFGRRLAALRRLPPFVAVSLVKNMKLSWQTSGFIKSLKHMYVCTCTYRTPRSRFMSIHMKSRVRPRGSVAIMDGNIIMGCCWWVCS